MQSDNSNSTSHSQDSPKWVAVQKTVKCNRCGGANLAWQQSKSGKWYLCVTRQTAEGKLEADRRGFHRCQPPVKNAHGLEVSDADIPF